jgi:hypothetical protein
VAPRLGDVGVLDTPESHNQPGKGNGIIIHNYVHEYIQLPLVYSYHASVHYKKDQ